MNNCLCCSHNPRLYINKKLFAIRRKTPACQTTFPVKKTYQEGKHPKNLNPGKDSFSRQKTRLPLASTLRNISPVFIFPIKYRLYFTGRFSATPSSGKITKEWHRALLLQPLQPGFSKETACFSVKTQKLQKALFFEDYLSCCDTELCFCNRNIKVLFTTLFMSIILL